MMYNQGDTFHTTPEPTEERPSPLSARRSSNKTLLFGDYWNIKVKYEELEEKCRGLEHEIAIRQDVIERYQRWFKQHEHILPLSEVPKKHPRRQVWDNDGYGMR